MDWLTFLGSVGLTLIVTYFWRRHINRKTALWQHELAMLSASMEPMKTEQNHRLLYWQMVKQVYSACPQLLLTDMRKRNGNEKQSAEKAKEGEKEKMENQEKEKKEMVPKNV